MQKDYGKRKLAHMEWEQVCAMGDAVQRNRQVTKGAGLSWLDDEDGSACGPLTLWDLRRNA